MTNINIIKSYLEDIKLLVSQIESGTFTEEDEKDLHDMIARRCDFIKNNI